MNKIKKILSHIMVLFYFGMAGFVVVLLLTGAFKFATAFIENRTPGLIEWLGMIFVVVLTGVLGLALYSEDTES